jgi:hypothetical protein
MATENFHISPGYEPMLAELGIDSAARVFVDDRLRMWRNLPDRDNSTLDATLKNGRAVRLHVKRDKFRRSEPMALEARGIGLLESAGIASAPLVAYGDTPDGRTFVITENLDGYHSADRMLERGEDLEPITEAMCVVSARLHLANLHHRDLYANHFYMRIGANGAYEVRLIDTARVKPLPSWFRERWIVKDVAQLHFSIQRFTRSPDDSNYLLRRYCELTERHSAARFLRRVKIKSQWIDRHDRALQIKKPTRNVRLEDGN